jgi:hypothetical protein
MESAVKVTAGPEPLALMAPFRFIWLAVKATVPEEAVPVALMDPFRVMLLAAVKVTAGPEPLALMAPFRFIVPALKVTADPPAAVLIFAPVLVVKVPPTVIVTGWVLVLIPVVDPVLVVTVPTVRFPLLLKFKEAPVVFTARVPKVLAKGKLIGPVVVYGSSISLSPDAAMGPDWVIPPLAVSLTRPLAMPAMFIAPLEWITSTDPPPWVPGMVRFMFPPLTTALTTPPLLDRVRAVTVLPLLPKVIPVVALTVMESSIPPVDWYMEPVVMERPPPEAEALMVPPVWSTACCWPEDRPGRVVGTLSAPVTVRV